MILDDLTYNPETGMISRGGRVLGHDCGGREGKRYISISNKNKRAYAHRIAWRLMTGKWPQEQVDHINGDRRDNRWCNLRLVINRQNQQNASTRCDNKLKTKGVSLHKASGLYRATIFYDGRQHSLGYFKDLAIASAAYKAEARKRFGDYAR